MDYWQLFWETGAPEWYMMGKIAGADDSVRPHDPLLKEVVTVCKVKNG